MAAWTREGAWSGLSRAKVAALIWAVLVARRPRFVAAVLTYHHVIEVDASSVAPPHRARECGYDKVTTRNILENSLPQSHNFTVSTQQP